MTLLISSVNNTVAQSKYELNDLKILTQEGSHFEMLSHALDIRPIFRNSEWEKLVETSAIKYTTGLINKQNYNKEELKLLTKISHWPSLKKNEFYIKERNKLFLKDIKSCLTNNKDCTVLIEKYYSFEHPVEFSFDLISLIYSSFPNRALLIEYAKPLLKHEISEFYCHKPPLDKLVMQILASTDTSLKKEIHKDCIKSLTQALAESIHSNGRERKSSYKVLKKHNLLSESTKRWYFLTNFLTEYSNETVDESISILKTLSKNPSEREELLTVLKKLDPLPDSVFNLKPKVTKARIRILNRNFPEFISLYAQTCLDYLSGKKNFPNGNPTPNCHSFFENIEDTHMISLDQKLKYKNATKFIKAHQ